MKIQADCGPLGEVVAEKKTDLALPPCGRVAFVDESVELLRKHPALEIFRDNEKRTWVISEERLAKFRQAFNLSPFQDSGTTDTNDKSTDQTLFDKMSHYTPAASLSLDGYGVEVAGILREGDDIQELCSPALLRKIGATEYAEYIERQSNDLDSDNDDYEEETRLINDFLRTVEVLRVTIKSPQGLEIERAISGELLLEECNKQLHEAAIAGRDKVGQRSRVGQLQIDNLHQPEFLDIRALSPSQREITFNKIDLSEIPLDWIKEEVQGKRRVILFEDSTQGFAVINNGSNIFLHSDSAEMQKAINLYSINNDDYPLDLFKNSYNRFISMLRNGSAIKVHHLQKEIEPGSDSSEVKAVAHAIISEGSELYVKSTRTSRGQLIINVRPDEWARPRILSDSPEVGEFLDQLAEVASTDEAQPAFLAGSVQKKLACIGSLTNFLASLIDRMEAPIVERAIPVMRLKTEDGGEKIEFRMILQGDETLTVRGNYAKASLNDVAGNISIGANSRKTKDTIKMLYEQELASTHSPEQISQKTETTYDQLIAVAEHLGNSFADSLRHERLGGRNNMNDFAVDICPVWNSASSRIEFHLLEIQYRYGYTGLMNVEPEMAKDVAEYKAHTEERLGREAAEADKKRELFSTQQRLKKLLGILSTGSKDPKGSHSAD